MSEYSRSLRSRGIEAILRLRRIVGFHDPYTDAYTSAATAWDKLSAVQRENILEMDSRIKAARQKGAP